jgi:hypothetical protein
LRLLLIIVVIFGKVNDEWRWAWNSHPPLFINERPKLTLAYSAAPHGHGSRFKSWSEHHDEMGVLEGAVLSGAKEVRNQVFVSTL